MVVQSYNAKGCQAKLNRHAIGLKKSITIDEVTVSAAITVTRYMTHTSAHIPGSVHEIDVALRKP